VLGKVYNSDVSPSMFELAPVDLHLPFTDSKAEFVANYRAQLPILVA
jgi:hypothetical protein